MYGYFHIALSNEPVNEDELHTHHFTVTARSWADDSVISEIHDPFTKYGVIFMSTMYSWSKDWRKRLPLDRFSQFNPMELTGSVSYQGARTWVHWEQDARVLALTHAKSPLHEGYLKTTFANFNITAKVRKPKTAEALA